MRTFHRLSIPRLAHPLVRRLYELMNEEQIGVHDLAERSGISVGSLVNWRRRFIPRVDLLEACYNVLGYTLKPIRLRQLDREVSHEKGQGETQTP